MLLNLFVMGLASGGGHQATAFEPKITERQLIVVLGKRLITSTPEHF